MRCTNDVIIQELNNTPTIEVCEIFRDVPTYQSYIYVIRFVGKTHFFVHGAAYNACHISNSICSAQGRGVADLYTALAQWLKSLHPS
jgi:hypothetical protein